LISIGLTKDIAKNTNLDFINVFLYIVLFMWIVSSWLILFHSDIDTWFRNKGKLIRILILLLNIQPVLYGLLYDINQIPAYLIFYLACAIILSLDQLKETRNFGVYILYIIIIGAIMGFMEIFSTLLLVYIIFIATYLNPILRLRKHYIDKLPAGA
jgi:hypothetical protein